MHEVDFKVLDFDWTIAAIKVIEAELVPLGNSKLMMLLLGDSVGALVLRLE